jgi:hypothetical protein
MLVWQIGENASFDPSVLKLNRTFGLQRIAVPANAALMATGGISRVHEEDSFEALLRWLAFQLFGVSARCL